MSHHYHPIETCIARIFVENEDQQQVPSGMGVVLDGGSILTCAHVVNPALQSPYAMETGKEKPEKIFTLDFPLSGSNQTVTATVGYWDAVEDLAELRLIDSLPVEVEPTHLRTLESLNHRVKAFGFSIKNLEGTWAECKLRGKTKSGWIEVFDPYTTGNFIKQGFSGGPVWDEESDCCIGIIVAVEKNDAARVGYLIPSNKIADEWKDAHVKIKYSSKKKQELPTLLPYRVDRRKQEANLRELYKNFEKNDYQKPFPLVGIIHGDEKQAPDMFLKRIENEYLPKLLNTHTKVRSFQVQWPAGNLNPSALGKKLESEVADAVLHNPDEGCENVQRTLVAYNAPIMITMELLTGDWVQHKKGILEAILDFWNKWPPLSSNQKLFVFLYVTHTIPESNWIKRQMNIRRKNQIFMQLAHCAYHHYSRLHTKVFDELGNVSLADTRAWARTEAREFFDGDVTALLAKIRQLFEKEEKIPMEYLASHLKEILVLSSGD